MLSVNPFANPSSRAFYNQAIWVRASILDSLTIWEHGPAKLLDVTKPYACAKFKKMMLDFKKEYGIDGFLFNGGQSNYLPTISDIHQELNHPDEFSRYYIELADDIASKDRFGLIKMGVSTQHIPLMLCITDKSSTWGDDNGLRTVIPTVLTLGIMGYPFILPGTVGGYTPKEKPSSELYIRWLETVIFMPGMKISIPPWEYGEETLCKVLSLMAIRQR